MSKRPEPKSIDEILRQSANTTVQRTPEPLPSDDLSSGRNVFDRLMNSADYHDEKAKKKFKELKFTGIVLRHRALKGFKDLSRRTSEVFANYIIGNNDKKSKKIYEMFVHIPDISGILPQPTIAEVRMYDLGLVSEGKKKYYETLTNRYPKFYWVGNQSPNVLDLWQVSFPDENFLYYGQALSLSKSAGILLASGGVSKEDLSGAMQA